MSDMKEKILYELGFTYAGLSGKTQKDFGRGKPFIPFMNIMSNGKIDPKFLNYVDVASNENQNAVQIGDLFFTTSSETPEEVGMTSVLLEDIGECYLNSFCFGFRLYNFDDLLPEFAPYLFRGNEVRKQIINLGQGYTRFNLPKTELLKKLKLNLPSILEQRKISKILTTADSVIEKTQVAIAKYKVIKQGMLQDLFTRGIDITTNQLRPRFEDAPHLYKESKLGMIPVEWDEKVFGKEVDLIHGHQFRDYDFTEFGIPVVKIGQVKPENVDLSNCSFVRAGREEEFQNEIIRNGDVLMALTGATLGKACLVKGLNGIVLQNYRVGRFEPIIKENDIDKEFLYYLLIAGDLLTQIFNKVNTGAQGNIGKADFEKATFKKPPFEEQQEIAKRLKSIDNKLEIEQTYLQKMQLLKKGLLEDLLSGKKIVNVDGELLNQNKN
jgi:type I restriction enzyme S subunit